MLDLPFDLRNRDTVMIIPSYLESLPASQFCAPTPQQYNVPIHAPYKESHIQPRVKKFE